MDLPTVEEWVLAKLAPLNGAPLVILRDPQRMIVPGAVAVDGWAEENGYTAPFCHGNLALREIYEPLRGRADVKVLLVDRSREDARIPLFYPDLSSAAGPAHQLTLTLQDYCIETTRDRRWPQAINERRLATLALKHLSGILHAHGQLREVDATRFTDTDLHKIVLGAVLSINPFRRATVPEIRRLCVEQHAGIEALQGVLSAEVMDTLRQMVASAPKPFCWLLDRDPEWVVRAYALAILCRQHKLEHTLLLPNLAPELHAFRDIEAAFLDQALEEQLRAEPDRLLDDVQSAEAFLIERPERLALLARDQLQLDDPKAALDVLRHERVSELLRSLALLSLLADLLSERNLPLHRQAAELLREQEQASDVLALRRPSEAWEALRACYERALRVHEYAAQLSKSCRQIRVLADDELTFVLFDDIWNRRYANRLDYYVSDVERTLRLGNLLPLATDRFWPELRERWEAARRNFEETVQRGIVPWHAVVDARFQDLCRRQYGDWIQEEDGPAVMVHQFLRRMVKAHWDPQSGAKAIILVFDGLRTDAWEEIVRPVMEERLEVIESRPGLALLPTETNLSRKAIAGGCLPEAFISTNEATLLSAWLREHMDLDVRFEVIKDDDTAASGISIRYTSEWLDYVVFDFTDNNLHHNNQDLAFIYGTTVQEIMAQDVRSVLRELPDNAMVFVTSDHGVSRSATGYVAIHNNTVADPADCRYRNVRAQRHLRDDIPDKVIDLDARRMGLLGSRALVGAPFSHMLFPRPGYGFKRPHAGYNPDRYSHGGLSLAECLVPMVAMGPKRGSQQMLVLANLTQVGARSEDEPLSVEIDIHANVIGLSPTPVTLSFSEAGLPQRREVVGSQGARFTVSWKPRLGEINEADRDRGVLTLPLTVTLTYQQKGQTQRMSRTVEMRIKLDPTRIRRRMHTGLDLLMGKRP